MQDVWIGRLCSHTLQGLSIRNCCYATSTWGMFRIRVIFGHSAISPEKWTFSDGRPVQPHACKNKLLSHRLAKPFSDIYLYTDRAAWRVKAHLVNHASGCFSGTYIVSSVLVTGFCTYPELTSTGVKEVLTLSGKS
jgi:hypothetical protein